MSAAASNPDTEAIAILLQAGADIAAKDSKGMTALMMAARSNPNADVVIALLNAGSDPKVKSQEGKTAFDYAMEDDKYFFNKSQKLLLPGVSVSVANDNKLLKLARLVFERGTPQHVAVLLSAGLNVNLRNKEQRTVLMLAAESSPYPEVIRTLLDYRSRYPRRQQVQLDCA